MYQARLVDGLLEQLMADFPAVVITGPRATGKTTTAVRHTRSVVRRPPRRHRRATGKPR